MLWSAYKKPTIVLQQLENPYNDDIHMYKNKSSVLCHTTSKNLLTRICSIIFRIWGSKPMSNILSASSKTRYVHLLRLVLPLSRKSMSRPGVAITISTPRSKSLACGPLGAPPNMHVFLICDVAPKSFATCCICCANSRVGARIKAIGPSPRARRDWLLMCTMAGSVYWKYITLPITMHKTATNATA